MYRALVAIIVGFALWRLWSRVRTGEVSTRRLIAWSSFWLGVLLVGMRPDLADYVALWLGIERGATLGFFIAILVLFYLILHLHLRAENLQQQITDLVRQLALRDMNRDEKRQQANHADHSPPRNDPPA